MDINLAVAYKPSLNQIMSRWCSSKSEEKRQEMVKGSFSLENKGFSGKAKSASLALRDPVKQE